MAVFLHHLLIQASLIFAIGIGGVRPHHDGIALRSGLADRIRRIRRHINRRMRVLIGPWQNHHIIIIEIFSVMREALTFPGLLYNGRGFAKAVVHIIGGHAKQPEFDRIEPPARSPIEAAFGENIQHAEFFDQPERMVIGIERNRGADAKPLCPRRNMRTHQRDRRANAVICEMMFRQPDAIKGAVLHPVHAFHRPLIYGCYRAPAGPCEKL